MRKSFYQREGAVLGEPERKRIFREGREERKEGEQKPKATSPWKGREWCRVVQGQGCMKGLLKGLPKEPAALQRSRLCQLCKAPTVYDGEDGVLCTLASCFWRDFQMHDISDANVSDAFSLPCSVFLAELCAGTRRMYFSSGCLTLVSSMSVCPGFHRC